MAFFSDFSGMETFFRRGVQNSLRYTAVITGQFLKHTVRDEENTVRCAVLAFVKMVLEADGEPLDENDLDVFRQNLERKHSRNEVDRMVAELRSAPAVSTEETFAVLQELPQEEKLRLLRFLLTLAVSANTLNGCEKLLSNWAVSSGFTADEFKTLRDDIAAERERRTRIIRSGAGILAALIVIAVFILTATLLRSVIFGLIAAYLLLPVEKYFERRLNAHKGFGYLLLTGVEKLFHPLTTLARKIRNAAGTSVEVSEKEQELRKQRKTITQAIALTCILLLLIFSLLGVGLSGLTRHYVRNWSQKVQTWSQTAPVQTETTPVQTAEPGKNPKLEQFSQKVITQSRSWLEQVRIRFENLPVVRYAIDQLSNVLKNPDAQRQLVTMILRKTGGFFSFTANVIGTIAALFADLLLTIFFFLLFLAKLAEFCPRENESRQSEYLVRTVFNGKWLPGASEATIAEAQRIISGVISRLRTYIRGYLTLVCVDSTVYTTCFFFIGVPYFPILGVIAGCGILLPYLGPILSTSLTVLVMLASGCTGTQLIAVLIAYLVYNGIIEQFILYPAVIGESLGLTTLETIIVVLLGAIFAGIPGMLLALPAASVLKYLVPQIYNCFETKNEI
ncbi:MAG: AI-2E family transporter [Lentisphaeria bacterium]|nr:AI-2E family transporter [Lentisphaeria bacterium]